jgi:replication initiation protein RepC
MEIRLVTTPFGRRAVSLAVVKGQLDAAKAPAGTSVDKWKVFRDICDARIRLKLRDRALAVLNALLSFYPHTDLSSDDNLIVFPSNARLAARTNGIAETTLRENLALLVQAGIIHRRDSPNGKRYARKGGEGQIEEAYGFSLAPVLARAAEFALLAQDVEAERWGVRILRERITLLRRDIRKLISAAIEEHVAGPWAEIEAEFVEMLAGAARTKSAQDLALLEANLAMLQQKILNLLETQWKGEKSDGYDGEFRQHIQYQNTESTNESEPRFEQRRAAPPEQELRPQPERESQKLLPLGMVLRSCPEIVMYGSNGRISSWRELMTAAVVVRSMLGISPSAYQEACEIMGQENAAAVVACILERAAHITSPGGYLRDLTRKAALGQFSLGSMIMALARATAGNGPGASDG